MSTAIIVFGYERDLKPCLDAIKTDLPIEVIIDITHLGLAKSILTGVTNMFKKYDSLIIIEDDVIISPDFIDYMLRGLKFYEYTR